MSTVYLASLKAVNGIMSGEGGMRHCIGIALAFGYVAFKSLTQPLRSL